MTYNPPIGFGMSPFGTAPFGFGSVVQANPNVGRVFGKANNSVGSGKFINPETRDYQMDPNTGRLIGQDSAQQLVYLALITVKGTSIVTGMGQEFSTIKTVSDDFLVKATNLVKASLKLLIDTRVIVLNEVKIDLVNNKATDPNRAARIRIFWTDIAQNAQFTNTI